MDVTVQPPSTKRVRADSARPVTSVLFRTTRGSLSATADVVDPVDAVVLVDADVVVEGDVLVAAGFEGRVVGAGEVGARDEVDAVWWGEVAADEAAAAELDVSGAAVA
jgi:hypothetical protein